ncbi:hypothetical protein FNYG_05371 [Fusarium nygamai]|uniref:Uncharacterized protein n=1 Tax=Gibberella nygamai TaxID=42673 RepID=A0A2K0WGD6_GIBNY|nr:hypothetical protein FNYG_05371 [Fusarium nygamai]
MDPLLLLFIPSSLLFISLLLLPPFLFSSNTNIFIPLLPPTSLPSPPINIFIPPHSTHSTLCPPSVLITWTHGGPSPSPGSARAIRGSVTCRRRLKDAKAKAAHEERLAQVQGPQVLCQDQDPPQSEERCSRRRERRSRGTGACQSRTSVQGGALEINTLTASMGNMAIQQAPRGVERGRYQSFFAMNAPQGNPFAAAGAANVPFPSNLQQQPFNRQHFGPPAPLWLRKVSNECARYALLTRYWQLESDSL